MISILCFINILVMIISFSDLINFESEKNLAKESGNTKLYQKNKVLVVRTFIVCVASLLLFFLCIANGVLAVSSPQAIVQELHELTNQSNDTYFLHHYLE